MTNVIHHQKPSLESIVTRLECASAGGPGDQETPPPKKAHMQEVAYDVGTTKVPSQTDGLAIEGSLKFPSDVGDSLTALMRARWNYVAASHEPTNAPFESASCERHPVHPMSQP